MRAAHDTTHKTETVERHESAPRPALPDAVADALRYEAPEQDPTGPDRSTLREQTLYADAAPVDPDALNADGDGDRTVDELFG